MISRREQLFAKLVLACDMIVLAVSLIAAIELYAAIFHLTRHTGLWRFFGGLWILWIACPVWGLLLQARGLCSTRSYRSFRGIIARLLQVQVIGGLILMSAMYLIKMPESRMISQSFLAISLMLLLSEKLCVRALMIHRNRTRNSANRWKVLAIGSNSDLDTYRRILQDYPYWAVELVDAISWSGNVEQLDRTGTGGGTLSLVAPRRIDMSVADWHTVLQGYVVDEVVAVVPWAESLRTDNLAVACREKGITFRLLVQMPPAPVGRYHVEDLGKNAYLLSLETIPQLRPALLVKRAIDIVSACAGLLICGLSYLWYAWNIRRESPGPVLFRQQRVGQNGRSFTLYKFRTMYPDADKRLPELLKHNEMGGFMFKMKNDPRVTPTGKWFRRTHLDELPQFWNVLKGEMSLVGTRPPTPSEVAQYKVHHHRRLSMKPGLTGLWQLNGNGKVSEFEEVVQLDCEYIDNWSLTLDCRIIVRTLSKMLHRSGW
jgi:exopolysaccharide biosynthesis polyprenyl glycosylphosphotransferase